MGKDTQIIARGTIRQAEKKLNLAYLISRFGYTTKPIFTEMLGLKNRSQDRFFQMMEDKNMLCKFEFIESQHPLYLPRKKFIEWLEEIHPESNFMTSSPAKIPARLIRHTLFSQKIITINGGFNVEYITDRMMDDGIKKRPDMILFNDHAIEVELTYKGAPKTYEAFLNLLMGIHQNKYIKVSYYTPSHYIYNQLTKLFNSQKWAIPQKRGKPVSKEISPEMKQNFKFHLVEDKR